jgi:uncharacterized protein
MTDQERQMIEELARRIQSAPAPRVDGDADDLIRRTIGTRPDALYILTQTVLIQEMALNQAKAQIDELKQRAPQAQPGTSFLGGNQPGSQPARSGGYQGSSYQRGSAQQPPALPAQYAQQYAEPQYAPAQTGGRFSGFLQNAAQTAAGVVAGELAFSALSSIFGGHRGGFYEGSGFLGGGGVSPGSETIINNYYEDDRDRGGSGDGGLSPDLEDRRFAAEDSSGDDTAADDSDQLEDSSDYTDDSDDDLGGDDSSYDDGSGSVDI